MEAAAAATTTAASAASGGDLLAAAAAARAGARPVSIRDFDAHAPSQGGGGGARES